MQNGLPGWINKNYKKCPFLKDIEHKDFVFEECQMIEYGVDSDNGPAYSVGDFTVWRFPNCHLTLKIRDNEYINKRVVDNFDCDTLLHDVNNDAWLYFKITKNVVRKTHSDAIIVDIEADVKEMAFNNNNAQG